MADDFAPASPSVAPAIHANQPCSMMFAALHYGLVFHNSIMKEEWPTIRQQPARLWGLRVIWGFLIRLAIPKVSPQGRQALLLSGRRIEQLSRGSKKSPTPQSWMSGRKSFQPGPLCVYGVSVYDVISQTTPSLYVPPSDGAADSGRAGALRGPIAGDQPRHLSPAPAGHLPQVA